MAAAAQIFNQLDSGEMELVTSFAASLLKNRGGHTEAYERFRDIRERMTVENPMTMEEIDRVIHARRE